MRKRPKLYSDESMKAALIACKGPCGLTVRAAAKLWNIPFETLRGRHMGLHTSKRPGPKNVLTMSEESDIADHPELRQKHKSGLWSDDSDSEFGDNPRSLKEALGIEDMYGDSDDNDPVVKSTGTKSRPLPVFSSEPVAGPSGVRKRPSKEAWTTRQTSSSSSEEDLNTIASQVDSDDMFANSDEDVVVDKGGDEVIVDEIGDGEIRANVTYVIVNYEGTMWPGLVTKVVGEKYEVSCMRKSGIREWKFDTDKPDLCLYDRSDIVEIIKAPTIINSRNIMRCEEADKYWGGL